MKSYPIVLLTLLSFLVFSCDDLADTGSQIQPTSDQIKVNADTLHLATESFFIDSITSTQQDSFLLGTFYDPKYGTTEAEILAQVNCPLNFRFPPQSTPDSAKIVLHYSSWFGDGDSPFEVSIYEMNKKTFSFTGRYSSSIDPADYSDKSILLAQKVSPVKDRTKTNGDTLTYIKEFNLPSSFVQRFFPDTTKDYYTSDTAFVNNFFKGIYIKANYGAATMLNIWKIDLDYYFHHVYKKNGKDTVIIDKLPFPANSEVRQVNCLRHPDRKTVVNLNDPNLNYLSSPANIQTKVRIPLKKIKEKMSSKITNKSLKINSATLRVEVVDNNTKLPLPLLKYVLLVKAKNETEIRSFFTKKELPSATRAILGQLAYEVDSTGAIQYYYSYNLAALIENEIKTAEKNKAPLDEFLDLCLVPVSVKTSYSSSTGATTVINIQQQPSMGAATIRSGKNADSPMKINLVYSGF
ncbi:MAG TPA: DUF4270 domain-containing protein [Paludibacter sp.]|nr:DUF4270 domain-containing protein [Paludibacter sp.]